MTLSCHCGFDTDADWWWYHPADFQTLKTKRGRRCKSCNNLIKIGSLCLEFKREKYPRTFVEYKIYGDNEIPMPSWYLCEDCGEIFMNLDDIGYCVAPYDNMKVLMKEYHEITGFKY